MVDRDKVIKGLEYCIKDIECTGCPYEQKCFDADDDRQFGEDMMRDALALLKEQGEKIAIMRMVYGSDVNVVGEIVRCKDCKYWRNENEQVNSTTWLPCTEIDPQKDWYCAYGERRDADA